MSYIYDVIRYYSRKDIDSKRWDESIAGSEHPCVYAFSWYLDATEADWGALMMPAYQYVMPVASSRKLGFRYVYQPRFVQQLGVFTAGKADPPVVALFLEKLRKHFKHGNYAFNEANVLGEGRGYELMDSCNYSLDLSASYQELRDGYSSNCRRNLQKARAAGLELVPDVPVEELVELKRIHDPVKARREHYALLERMFGRLRREGHVELRGVRREGRLLCGAVLAYSPSRVHYLLSVSSSEGKADRAMFLLIDNLVGTKAGEDLVLDFEGSNQPSISRFFRGFGAKPGIYQRVSFYRFGSRIYQQIRHGKAS